MGQKVMNATTAIPQAEQMLEQIIAMQPRLRERAAEARQGRKVPQATVDELQELGFFLSLQPARYGGLELTPQQFFKMQMAIAEG
ncbi:MAG: 3-hydroxy-9,10-secoandrosta-1,3,5(10)-triene-9,17-dione monooxygenase, partial [Bacteroidia bacterium]